MIQEAIKTIVKGSELPFETARESMGEIMSGKASEAQIGAFLAALSLKGETVGEITGFARAMRDACVPVSHEGEVFEIVGTGETEQTPSTFPPHPASSSHPVASPSPSMATGAFPPAAARRTASKRSVSTWL